MKQTTVAKQNTKHFCKINKDAIKYLIHARCTDITFCRLCQYSVQLNIEIADTDYEDDYFKICLVSMFVLKQIF